MISNESHDMILSVAGNNTQDYTHTERDTYWEKVLDDSLELFDFSSPLPKKDQGTLRLFYNNCNGLEITNMIGAYVKQKKDKKTYNYLKDTESPTKLDGLLQKMILWDVDAVGLAETCIAWEDSVPRSVTKQITQRYDKLACWTVSTSKINVGSFLKPGGTGLLTRGICNGRVKDRGTDPWGMGRWSFSVIGSGKRNLSVMIVTGYRPSPRNESAGFKTTWRQQQTILLKTKRTEPPHIDIHYI